MTAHAAHEAEWQAKRDAAVLGALARYGRMTPDALEFRLTVAPWVAAFPSWRLAPRQIAETLAALETTGRVRRSGGAYEVVVA